MRMHRARLAAAASALIALSLTAAPALAEGGVDEPPEQPFEITDEILDRSITVYDPARSITEYDPARSITELGGGETAEDEVIVLEADILFDSNAWDLPEGASARIAELAADVPEGASVQVGGHTDALPVDRSRYDFDNQELSENRAQAVADALAEERPDLTLEVTGHGDSQPVTSASAEDAVGLAENRRVELRYGD
jgi:OOP family OmpA-OmpF porin